MSPEGVRHWNIRVPRELSDWFDEHYPMRGSKQWWVEETLETLREAVESGEVEPPVSGMELIAQKTGESVNKN